MLEEKGWILARIRGSHHLYLKPGRVERISVPVHGEKPLKTGLQRYLMKLAEIQDFEL